MKKPRECGHEVLNFSNGAFYIHCMMCDQFWTAIQHNADLDDGAKNDAVLGSRIMSTASQAMDTLAKYRGEPSA